MEGTAAITAALAAAIRRGGGDADVTAAVPDGYAVAGPRPACTVRVRDEAALRQVVATAAEYGWGVVVRGAGTLDRMGGPLRVDPLVVLDDRGLDGIVAHAPGDLTVRVRAGTRLAALNASLRSAGQRVSLVPPFAERATVGGAVAADSWGPERAAHGSARDLVLGLRVVDGRGDAFATGAQVVKNVSGLDIGKLFIGSFGTLGVLTEVALRLRPLPPSAAVWAMRAPDLAAAWGMARGLAESRSEPVGAALDSLGGALTLSAALEGVPAEIAWQTARLDGLGPGAPLDAGAAAEAWRAAHAPLGGRPWAALRVDVPEGALAQLWRVAAGCPDVTRLVAWLGMGTLWCTLGREAGETLALLRREADAAGGGAVLAWMPAPPPAGFSPFGDLGELAGLVRGIKGRFDPAGVLGPGRMALG